MLKLVNKNVDAGTWLVALEIFSAIKYCSEFCGSEFCLRFIANFLKKRINAGIVFLIGVILEAIDFAYLVFKFRYVISASDCDIKINEVQEIP